MNRDSHLIFEAYRQRLVKEQDENQSQPQPARADIGPDIGPVQSNLDFPTVDDGYKTNLVYYKNKHARVENAIAQTIFEKLPARIEGSEIGEKIQQVMREQEPPIERRAFMDVLEALINGKAFYGLPPEAGVEGAAEPSEQDVEDEVRKLPAFQMAQRQSRRETEDEEKSKKDEDAESIDDVWNKPMKSTPTQSIQPEQQQQAFMKAKQLIKQELMQAHQTKNISPLDQKVDDAKDFVKLVLVARDLLPYRFTGDSQVIKFFKDKLGDSDYRAAIQV